MALVQTTSANVRQWIVDEVRSVTPIERTIFKFQHVSSPDLQQNGAPTAAKDRSFGVQLVTQFRSDAMFGAYQATYELIIVYQSTIIDSDLDAIQVHFDQMRSTDFDDGIIGVAVNPVWQVGEEEGRPYKTMHFQIIVDYFAKGAQ